MYHCDVDKLTHMLLPPLKYWATWDSRSKGHCSEYVTWTICLRTGFIPELITQSSVNGNAVLSIATHREVRSTYHDVNLAAESFV